MLTSIKITDSCTEACIRGVIESEWFKIRVRREGATVTSKAKAFLYILREKL